MPASMAQRSSYSGAIRKIHGEFERRRKLTVVAKGGVTKKSSASPPPRRSAPAGAAIKKSPAPPRPASISRSPRREGVLTPPLPSSAASGSIRKGAQFPSPSKKKNQETRINNCTMDSSDQEQQVRERHQQGHHGSAELHDDSPSSATCDLKSAVANFGARFLIPSCFRSPSGLPHALPLTRVYQVWPGKNVFFFDGKVICGPDPRGLILTAISVLLSEWIFLADIVDPPSKHPILIAAFSIALAATVRNITISYKGSRHCMLCYYDSDYFCRKFVRKKIHNAMFCTQVIVTLLLTATRDPGIIPRNQASPSEEASASSLRRTRSRRIIIDGIETKQKYCRICRIFRPPRSSHCAVCDNCVDKFDHHCPWIGQCIGLRNYRLYLLLISLALAFHIYTFTFSVRRIRVKMDATSAGIFSLLRTMPEMFALAAFSFMAIWFLACLLPLHAFLVAKNQTNHERYKGRYRDSPNPYDKGALKNIKECLFDKLPPPRVDFRAVARATLGSAARTTVSSASPATDGGAGEMLPLGMRDCTVLGANDAQRIKLVD